MISKNSIASIAIQLIVALLISQLISASDTSSKWIFVIVLVVFQIFIIYYVNKEISSLEKFKSYLKDHSIWDQNNEYVFFNKKYPEFTIKEVENHSYKGNEKNEWARGEIGFHYTSGNCTYVWGLYHYSTLLKEIVIVNFDGGKKTLVNPIWKSLNGGRIYYYLRDSVEYIFQQFWTAQHGNRDDSKNLKAINASFTKFDIPVFKNDKELKCFLDKNNQNADDIESDIDKQNEIFYTNIESYIKWKK